MSTADVFAHELAARGRRGIKRCRRATGSIPCTCRRRTRWRALSTPPSPRRRACRASRGCTRASGHSISTIFWGFVISSIFGVPLGILCGTYRFFSRLQEPFIEFFRYLPAPAFGALCVAILGIDDAPKIAIIFIGTFFQQVLVIATPCARSTPR
jgi:NitT/TauT family transport system permease protein